MPLYQGGNVASPQLELGHRLERLLVYLEEKKTAQSCLESYAVRRRAWLLTWVRRQILTFFVPGEPWWVKDAGEVVTTITIPSIQGLGFEF